MIQTYLLVLSVVVWGAEGGSVCVCVLEGVGEGVCLPGFALSAQLGQSTFWCSTPWCQNFLSVPPQQLQPFLDHFGTQAELSPNSFKARLKFPSSRTTVANKHTITGTVGRWLESACSELDCLRRSEPRWFFTPSCLSDFCWSAFYSGIRHKQANSCVARAKREVAYSCTFAAPSSPPPTSVKYFIWGHLLRSKKSNFFISASGWKLLCISIRGLVSF